MGSWADDMRDDAKKGNIAMILIQASTVISSLIYPI